MDELLSIGEFSERCGLSPKMLRSYADAGLLVPAAVDRITGYRYYSPGQIHEAEVVAGLRQAGIAVAEIRGFLDRPTPGSLAKWERRLVEEHQTRRDALDRVRELLALDGEASNIAAPRAPSQGGRPLASLVATSATHIGRVRRRNEDTVVVEDHLVAVADGMGGMPGGELASRTAAEALRRQVWRGSLSDLRDAVSHAGAEVWERSRTDPELDGMGTTICAAAVVEVDGRAQIGIAHVGDSRAYLVRDGKLTQLTEDHTVVADLIRRGELDERDAADHPHRHVLTRVLGVAPSVDPDMTLIAPEPGDRLLLCTDGLFNEVDDDSIAALVAGDTDNAAEHLVDAAVAAGGNDNVSVVIVDLVVA